VFHVPDTQTVSQPPASTHVEFDRKKQVRTIAGFGLGHHLVSGGKVRFGKSAKVYL
jgi:hypothetical protein